jgi:HEAT repeat protein
VGLVQALELRRDARAVGPLLSALRKRDPTIRFAAVAALAEIGDPAALAPLEELGGSSQDEALVRAASEAAARIRVRGKDAASATPVAPAPTPGSSRKRPTP